MILPIVYVAGFLVTFGVLNTLGIQWAKEDLRVDKLEPLEHLEVNCLAGFMALFWPVMIILLSFKLLGAYLDGDLRG